MGTDIHAAIEYKEGNKWIAIMRPNPWAGKDWGDGEIEPELTAHLCISRNYDLFAILGNVQNGVGFAGCDTGDPVKPISDNRGVPEDISPEADKALSCEHSATYVSFDEILAYDWTQKKIQRSWVNAVELANFLRDGKPKSYCGGVSGGKVQHLSFAELANEVKCIQAAYKTYKEQDEKLKEISHKYCQIEWGESLADCAGFQFWQDIFAPMLKLGNQYGYENVRLVMDFDS